MRILSIVFMLVCAAAYADPPAIDISAETVPVAGYYKVRGTDPKGETYTAIATVNKVNKVYVLTWVNGSAPMVRGSGLLMGDKLAIGWVLPGANVAGCTLYTVAPGGKRLTGRWTAGAGQVCDESMVFFAEFDEDE